ncbi:MAG: radical SAM protein [Gemmatimonadetes bacterium]|nr:radical SAM protein [Gemmatimonadota bacterium]
MKSRREPSGRGLPVLDERARGTRFLAQRVHAVLNAPESTGIGCWTLNPYVGCEFGCTYCYARFAHRYVLERARDDGRLSKEEFSRLRGPRGWEGFERHILVKPRETVIQALDRDLPRVLHRARSGDGETLLIGSATDPYQPAERRFEVTRAILERLLRERGLTISLITKSSLVCRDAELLAALGERHLVLVNISLISTDGKLIKLLKARSPAPHVRLRTLRRLSERGVHAGLLVAPILPGLTDSVENLRLVLEAAKAHGARFAHPSPLRLYPAVRPLLLPLIEKRFPSLAARYRDAYTGMGRAPKEYHLALTRRFERVARVVGIPVESERRAAAGVERQLNLWPEQRP